MIKPSLNGASNLLSKSIQIIAAILLLYNSNQSALASNRLADSGRIQQMLNIAPSPNQNYFQILNARSFGLSDTASVEEIQKASLHAEYLAEAKVSGWPLNLTDGEYSYLINEKSRQQLAEYGYPEVETNEFSRILISFKESLLCAPRNLFDLVSAHLSSPLRTSIGEFVGGYEIWFRTLPAKQAHNLPPWASAQELEAVQIEELRCRMVKSLHLKPSASFDEINLVQRRESRRDYSLLLHRMFKASATVPDDVLAKQLKPLAHLLGYPFLNRGTQCAGGRVLTADGLLDAAANPTALVPIGAQ